MNVESFKQKVKLIGKLSQGAEGGCWSREHVPGSQILVMAIIKNESEKTSKQTNTRLTVFVWKRRFFFSVWPTVHTYPVKTGYQKRIISKTLSSVEMFDRLAVLLWEDKTKVVENNYVTELDTTFTVARWRAKPIQKRNVWTRIFWKREKKSPGSNKTGYVRSGL